MELSELSMHVDNYVKLREQRLAADKVAAALKKDENAVMQLVLDTMVDSDMNMVGGSEKRVTRRKTTGLVVDDWDALNNWVLATGNVQILSRRIAVGAYKEITEGEGIKVPSVSEVEINKLSVAKL